MVQEVALYSTHSCGCQEEGAEAVEDPQQTCEEVDEVEEPVDVLQSQHHRPGPSAVSEPAACLSNVSS